jgi:hypothetical protein
MPLPRPVAPRLVAALGAFATLSCAGLLGIDDEQSDVARELCQCEEGKSFKGKSCEEHIAHRLEIATPSARQAWMQKFYDTCAKGCTGCWETMFYTRPTCTDPDGACATDDCSDCCFTTTPGASECAAKQ